VDLDAVGGDYGLVRRSTGRDGVTVAGGRRGVDRWGAASTSRATTEQRSPSGRADDSVLVETFARLERNGRAMGTRPKVSIDVEGGAVPVQG
jgi:hypothetical protein